MSIRYPWGTQIWEHAYTQLKKIYTKIEEHEKLPAPRKAVRMSVSGYSYPFKVICFRLFISIYNFKFLKRV